MIASTCAGCATPLEPEDVPRGVCPRCLIDVALKAPDQEGEELGPGDRIGPYEILEPLGEGGMGLVFLAEQREPIRRRVALKVVKPGMDSREVLARFESERRAVALMDHPNIARVHEAGVTAGGRPYFAMEHVQGSPVTEYCDRRRLPLRSRLELFLQVCRAVQHAHQKGIIHRDLKPSNVLVSEADGQALVKVIDFGVAKAIQPEAGVDVAITRQGLFLGTPQYMSPEQAATGGRDVDTRTDVYALGLLLYELLTGALPFATGPSQLGDLDELRRRIREEEPPRPTSRLRTLGDAAPAAANARRTDPAGLLRALRGDLDWILVRALEKDPARRYATPLELAGDLERHLRHEPVVAGPPGAGYRIGKFVRRHRLAVAVTTGFAVLLLGFAIAMAVQAGRIAAERDRASREAAAAQRVSEFLVNLFHVSDPGEARGGSVSAREILDAGAARIESELGEDPEVRARLMATMGAVYKHLGLFEPAARLLERSRDIRLGSLGPAHADTLRTSLEIGELLYLRGDLAEAERLLRETLAACRSALGEDHPSTLAALADLAVVIHHQGRLEEAEPLYLEALRRRREALGADHPETLETTSNVAALLMAQGKAEAAEPYSRAGLEGRRSTLGADHPETLDSMMNLGVVLQVLKRYDEAEPLCREAVEVGRRIRPDHPKTLVSINNLGKLLELEGKLAEAEPLYREALTIFRRTLGDAHTDTLTAMGNLGELYGTQGRFEEAEALLAAAAATARRTLPAPHVVTGYTLRKYGRLLGRTGRLAEAETTLLEAQRMLEATAGKDHPQTRRATADLDEVRQAGGKQPAPR